jgi:hypothetical protein
MGFQLRTFAIKIKDLSHSQLYKNYQSYFLGGYMGWKS